MLSGPGSDGIEGLLSLGEGPCAVLSLPDACVAPCYPLLQECEAARLLMEGLLGQPLTPQQLVLKDPRQEEQEGEELQRHLAEPYEQLTDILHAYETASTTTPPS